VARAARAVEGLGRLYGLVNLEECYKGRSVFVTGHTGFKGSWLTEWLLLLGARVTGYSLPPPTEPALFTQLGLRDRIVHFEADIRQSDHLRQALLAARPDFVFHLAAQSLVRLSYLQPKETYDVNVMGTINVLETLRALDRPCAAVFITTDKCYEQKESIDTYREGDALGGHDPYSSSKAAAELAIAAYRHSFFSMEGSKIALASARAGNVLGGGDWAIDRIGPDCIRALAKGESIAIRNRLATRPWQHVLEPLSGYLELGAALAQLKHKDLSGAFNFGPATESDHSVLELVEEIIKHWPGTWHDQSEPNPPHEAQHLRLATDKALRLLGWSSAYGFAEMVEKMVDWYRQSASFASGDVDSFVRITQKQITDYQMKRENRTPGAMAHGA
jgi:CDP-glucose 4,6-dehydratase